MCKCTRFWMRTGLQVHPLEKNKFLKTPVLPHTITKKATGLHRLQVCTAQWVKWKSRYPSSHPAALIFNCHFLVTFYAVSALSVSQWGCQVLNKETFSKEIRTSLAVSYCEDIFSEMTGWEQIPQQRINAVPLNYIKLSKQQEARLA